MKVRTVLSLTALAALTACANVKDVRDRDPVFYGATQRSAEDYTNCVAESWKNLGINFERKTVRNGFELIQQDSLGVDAKQGYLYAKPMPAAEFTAWLTQRRRLHLIA